MLSPKYKKLLKKWDTILMKILGGLLITGCGAQFTVEQQGDLEGYYPLPNGGFIEILKRPNGSFVLYGLQRVLSVNFDEGLALHPNIPAGPHISQGKTISGLYTTNYSSTTNDVEVDGGTSNISGSRLTRYFLSVSNKDKLSIVLTIYSSSGLTIDAVRDIVSQ